MVAKKRGLGRGLEALLGSAATAVPPPVPAAVARGEGLRTLPVGVIRRGRSQPRSEFPIAGLEELAESIRAQGVVQPIVVRGSDADGYEIIAGERRWRAAQMAGLQHIPALVRDVSDQAALAMALIENIQREDLSPLDEARAIQRLAEDHGLTHQQVAESIGRSRTAVTNLLRLLDLEAEVAGLLRDGRLEMGHARALLSLDGRRQIQVAREVVAKGLSVRETERLVRRLQAAPPSGPAGAPPRTDPDIQRLEERLSGQLGARVKLDHRAGGKGRLVVQYNSLDELDGILAHIK
ncbi:MAG: chromosome partitioning protein ParB [Chromatiales bacterium 21-64-14]|nr:MAG: chromosome partitioning protein ParB [Chromatiales bacterium 21-64-14]HQU16234.1 ParB/RepB/Spo0J family partition protein [Gammaproteobacteria bacterium]